jgi:hypothetical protein
LVVSFISFIRNSLTYYKMCYILKFGTIHWVSDYNKHNKDNRYHVRVASFRVC